MWVSHFFQNETDDFGFLSVEKQRTEFRLSGRCFDKFQDSTRDMNVSVEPDRFAVARKASKENPPAGDQPFPVDK